MNSPNDDTSRRSSSSSKGRILVVPLSRIHQQHNSSNASHAKSASPPKAGPCRAAQVLALAHELQRLIDEGEVVDRATLAEQLGFTRARLTQILDLLLLAPDIQESVLLGKVAQSTERCLRQLPRLLAWKEQRLAIADKCELVDLP